MKLQMSLEQASFSDSQKQSMLDVNNNISCQGITHFFPFLHTNT